MEEMKNLLEIKDLRIVYDTQDGRVEALNGASLSLKEGQTLKSLYEERTPLYEKYAHLTVDEEKAGIRETVELVVQALKEV